MKNVGDASLAARSFLIYSPYCLVRVSRGEGIIGRIAPSKGKRLPGALTRMEPEVAQAAMVLGLRFNRWDLLRQSLIHRSYLNEEQDTEQSNERLEFLGDAALGFVVGRWLYERYPDLPEGALTRRRMALVSNQTLARWARAIGLEECILISKGERGAELPDRVLGGMYEAVLAAILLDRGQEALEQFLSPILETEADEVVARTIAGNFKGRLQELVQERERVTPAYITLDETGADAERRFTVAVRAGARTIATATGRSKQVAEQLAAQRALEAYEDGDAGGQSAVGDQQ